MCGKPLVQLIETFDVDTLAGQSYALFPAGNANLKSLVGELEKALQADAEGSLANMVRVVPLERVNAALVMSPQPRYVEAARRFFHLTNRVEDATARSWHVYYVQNGQSADLEALLQRAFTPGHVSATPPPLEPLQTIDELRRVIGMPPGVVAALRPHLSLYAPAEPDPAAADPVVLAALDGLRQANQAARTGTPVQPAADEYPARIVHIAVSAEGPADARTSATAIVRLPARPGGLASQLARQEGED